MLLENLKKISEEVADESYNSIINEIISIFKKEMKTRHFGKYEEAIFLEKWIFYLDKSLEKLEPKINEEEVSETIKLKYYDYLKIKNKLELLLECRENSFCYDGFHYLNIKISRLETRIKEETASENDKELYDKYIGIRKALLDFINVNRNTGI